MPKLICPNCMKPVAVPDDFAGRQVTCQACTKSFDAPSRYTPAVLTDPPPPSTPAVAPPRPTEPPPMSPEVPPAPPGFLPPPSGVVPVPPPVPSAAAVMPAPAGYTQSRGFAISPKVTAWLPAVFLTLTLFCTFFAWVGTYLGGYPVNSQGPWRAMFGSVNRNLTLESAMQTPSGWLNKVSSDWELMVPFALLLLAATALAWADRGFHSLDPRRIPPIAKVWPWRRTIIAILAILAFELMLIQVWSGFGLQRAVRGSVAERFATEREKAAGDRAELAKLEYAEEQDYAKFNLERTSWLYAGLTFNLLAVLAVILHIGLERRGDRPPPRIVLQY